MKQIPAQEKERERESFWLLFITKTAFFTDHITFIINIFGGYLIKPLTKKFDFEVGAA